MPLLTAALALLSFIGPLSTDMYLPAFPRMADELATDASGVQLTLTAFLVGMTLGHLVFGPLSDRYGRRRPLLVGAVVCTVGTALCAVAPSLGWLVALRFLTGFSGAAGVVISRAVVSDVVQGAAAARLFGVLMTLAGIAPIIAPLAGGAVIGGFGWRAVFWVLAGVSALVTLAVVIGVPESLPARQRHTGGVRRTAGAVREVLGDRAYVGYTLAFTFGFGMLFCYIAGSPFLLQNVLGMGVGASSVAFSGGAVVATLSSAVGARLVGRVAPEALLRRGLSAMLAGSCGLLVLALGGLLSVAVCLPLLAVVCGGFGLVVANSAALALARVPGASGVGSALLGTAQSALGAVVAPLVGLGGEHTAVPLFLGMTLCAGCAVLSVFGCGRVVAGRAVPRAPGQTRRARH
ncbi:Bcr/CflA family drug resistance efflux transporter [Streptomyces venezuelae]|uniref:Bcr/CflA family drug resistance efflux transporter n=1 Tax=Streptomyces venezuelae TaxID=54571 RepID=A0A5P2CG05_STRVZ|nr:multidrug effflux MFS transporter [Streptomyces venezuelae]QES41200.1 Bcr/CflA family drug resistance efflux transporter [Streptomyces venezuelae]